jgi:phage minor structural protein
LLYLLNKDVRTVRWNGEPLHEATSAIVKEIINGDFTLTVKYPISDSGIYQLIQEDMLIKAPTPVLGAQLFRIKKPVEHNDHLEITAYHISDDVMQRSITPVSVTSQSCGMALSRMVQNTKTALGDFSFNSDIQDRKTFNTTETETLYSVLLDGKHSIVGTWEGELVRDNFAMTVKKSRGENRGVVITTHKNLKDYQRTKNSQNVVTRIHAKSTFKPEGAEKETTIRVTVDSPLINSYPYINEKEYENNNAKTVEELQKWAKAKFSNEGIDKVSDAIKIEAYELDGQVVHIGDTVNLKSWKHNVDSFKKAIAYEFDALKEEYISLTFDDKAGIGGSRASSGLSSAADVILGVTESAQEIALEKALQNADLDFDHQAGLLRQEILDGIEQAKAVSEENKKKLSDEINRRFQEFNPSGFEEAKVKAEEALRKVGVNTDLVEEAKRIVANNNRDLNAFKTSTQKEREKLSDELKRYSREEAENKLTEIREVLASDYVSKRTYVEDVEGTRQRLEAITLDNKTKLAEYKQTVDGQFTNLSSQIANKVDRLDFQQVKETSQLFERILGRTDSNVASNVARMALTSELFEVEVGKRFSNLTNLFYAPTKIPKYISSVATDKHLERVSWGDHDGIRINYTDSMSGWLGVRFPLTKKFVKKGEGLGYRIEIAVDKVPRDGRVLIQLLDNTPSLGMYYNSQILLTKTGNQVFTGYLDIPYTGELNEYSIRFTLTSPGNIVIHKPMVINQRLIPNEFVDSTDYNSEYNRVTMSLMKDSFAIKALNSAGDIIAGINVGANGNNRIIGKATHITGETLIDNAVIKSAMIDKLKTVNFEAGSVTTTILGANSVTAEKVLMDQAMARRFVSSDIFTDTLAAKTAFINKLRSVVVTATLLEGYKGRIGGFQIGTHDKDPSVYWLTGQNQFAVGMSNGSSAWGQTALWVNWGENWDKPKEYAWFVKRTGEMFCYNKAQFWNTPRIHGNLEVTGNVFYYIDREKNKVGYYIHSDTFTRIQENAGYAYLYRQSGGYSWFTLNKDVSDRRYKHNIEDSKISALEVINRLKTYSYRKEYDGKIEDISCGIMAQDVQKYAPEAFFENPDGAYSYNTFALVPYLIKAIQELNQKIQKLEKTS